MLFLITILAPILFILSDETGWGIVTFVMGMLLIASRGKTK